jgi:RNA polymerase sigma-70 factor (ECF subfamily)
MDACGHYFLAESHLRTAAQAPDGPGMTARRDDASLSPQESRRLLEDVAVHRDRAAFTTLFGFYAPRLKAFMMRSGMTAPVAEDLAQETMLLVWRKASYFDPRRAGVSTWIFTIARNLRVDRLRREARPMAITRAFDPSDEPDSPASGETVVMASEREERVRAALGMLSEEQAEILRLSFFAEKPQSEIATELGIPLGTVKSRTRLAFGRLRQILDDLK